MIYVIWYVVIFIVLCACALVLRMEWRLYTLRKKEVNAVQNNTAETKKQAHENQAMELMETLDKEVHENPFDKAFWREETTKPLRIIKDNDTK